MSLGHETGEIPYGHAATAILPDTSAIGSSAMISVDSRYVLLEPIALNNQSAWVWELCGDRLCTVVHGVAIGSKKPLSSSPTAH